VALRLLGKPFSGGGTSAATPIWAALVSRLSTTLGRPLGWLSPAFYAIGSKAFRDISRGNNDLNARGRRWRYYRAGIGWDACTGLGAPDGVALLDALKKGPGTAY
jgi:kumamolisin